MTLRIIEGCGTSLMAYLRFETAEQAAFACEVLNMFDVVACFAAGSDTQIAFPQDAPWRTLLKPWLI